VYCVCNFVRKVTIKLVIIAESVLIHMLNPYPANVENTVS